jgi:CHAT domain-containing protein
MIALSLNRSGEPDFLSPLDLMSSRVTAGLVVMSGCASGRGDSMQDAGLMGLTRAWLAAGTRAVAASHWATPDENGVLFQSFYEHLRRAPAAGPAAALRQAQIDMMRSGSWRGRPQYWAAFYVIGNS